MAFIAPAIVGYLALSGTTALVATAALQVGLSVGLGFIANKLTAKSKAGASVQSGRRVGLTIATDVPRQVIVGQTATAGSLVYWQLSGNNNTRLHMVVALADHECDGLAGVWVNGKHHGINSIDGNVNGFEGKLNVRFYPGTATQNADAQLIATSEGRWTADERGSNVCYVVVTADYDEKLLPEIPQMQFVVRGAKLYDPRTGLTAFTANPAVILWNVLRGIAPGGQHLIGMNVPAAAIRSDEFIAAANACDEIVAKVGGTEPRYRCGVILDTVQVNRDIIETILPSMAGELIETGGIYRIMAGVARSPVANLTDADLITDRPFVTSAKRPRSQLVNAVFGTYSAPDRAYEMVPLPNRTSAADELADGGIRLSMTLDLVAVTSRSQAQRIMEIERKRARRMLTVSGTFRARRSNLEPGDWVTLTSERRGYSSRMLEVVGIRGGQDLTTEIDFVEVDDQLDDWTTADEIADNEVSDLQSAGPQLSGVTGVVLTTALISSPTGAQRPGLHITWAAVDDPTVTGLALEYRRLGDTVALERTILDASTGSYMWLDGVVGDTEYQARLRPLTLPVRATEWSAWAQTASTTAPQLVDAIGIEVPNDSVDFDKLSPQARFELGLVTSLDEIQGSVNERLQRVADYIIATNEALATTQHFTAENDAYIARVERTVVTETQALAETIDTVAALFGPVQAQVNQNTSAIATHDGWSTRWSVSMTANGYMQGAITLDGTEEETTFGVLANNFVVAQPGVAGGAPKLPFTIGMVNGVSGIGISGNVIIDGAIAARHLQVMTLSAISADLGTVTAGLIRDAANTIRFDLDNMRIFRTDGKMDIDFKNLRFRMGS